MTLLCFLNRLIRVSLTTCNVLLSISYLFLVVTDFQLFNQRLKLMANMIPLRVLLASIIRVKKVFFSFLSFAYFDFLWNWNHLFCRNGFSERISTKAHALIAGAISVITFDEKFISAEVINNDVSSFLIDSTGFFSLVMKVKHTNFNVSWRHFIDLGVMF